MSSVDAAHSPRIHEDDVRATYRFLGHDGRGVTELRVISPQRGVVGIGYFDNEEAFVGACAGVNGAGNVYLGIQPRPAAFLQQSNNKIRRLRKGAHEEDVGWLTAVVIDIDPVRPKDTAATDEKLAKAIDCGDQISEWMEAKGFRRPVRNMSGNGCQLWFAIPPFEITDTNREKIRERLKGFEAKIRERFSADGVTIDSIFNLSRVIKVIGTRSVKGEARSGSRCRTAPRPCDTARVAGQRHWRQGSAVATDPARACPRRGARPALWRPVLADAMKQEKQATEVCTCPRPTPSRR